jgi:hypothetical protein
MYLKDGSTPMDPRLGRLEQFDDRSRLYCIAAAAPKTPVKAEWKCEQWLDQGQEGACVGFGITHEAIALPVAVKGLTATFAREKIYWEAQKHDGMPGGAYPGAMPFYEGTSVLAGLKAYKKCGLIDGYAWAFSLNEVLCGMALGPCILGIPWKDGMRAIDKDGLIHAIGRTMGGHCILATGVYPATKTVRLHNSWGKMWGTGGDCLISWTDLGTLLDERGEAAFVTGRHLKPKASR